VLPSKTVVLSECNGVFPTLFQSSVDQIGPVMDLRLFRLFRGPALCVFGLVLAASLPTVPAAEVPQELKQRQQQLLSAHEKARAAVVGVSDGMGVGSGVIVSSDGFVLSASHVV